MDSELLEQYVREGISGRRIAALLNTSQTNMRYWLKKYDIKQNKKHSYSEIEGERICTSCKISKPLAEFYKKATRPHTSCKKCLNNFVVIRQRSHKIDAINAKGGKCLVCKYDRCPSALEFHHLDPTKKDLRISKLSKKITSSQLIEELNKCVLLCANCHREVHSHLIDLTDYMSSGGDPSGI